MPSKPLTRTQAALGWCWLPVYLHLLAVLIRFALPQLGIAQDEGTINLVYFSANLLFVLLVFWSFLRQRFFGDSVWNFIQALIVALFAHYVGTYLAGLLCLLIDADFTVLNDRAVQALFGQSRIPMLFFAVLGVPLVEEVLVRGVVFGTLYPRCRFFAYGFSALFFAGMHVWQLALAYDLRTVLLNALIYLPAGLSLAWVYKKTDTIWAPIVMHALINAVSFGVLSLNL